MGNKPCYYYWHSRKGIGNPMRLSKDASSDDPQNVDEQDSHKRSWSQIQNQHLGEVNQRKHSVTNCQNNDQSDSMSGSESMEVSDEKSSDLSECIEGYNLKAVKNRGMKKKDSNYIDSCKSTMHPEESDKAIHLKWRDLDEDKKPHKKKAKDEKSKSYIDSQIDNESSVSISEDNDDENLNDILRLLKYSDRSNAIDVILRIRKNASWLKTALMTPINEFVKENPEFKIDPVTYLSYSPSDEIYGLKLVINNKNSKLFEFLWNDCGSLWWYDHIVIVLKELVAAKWSKGISKFFISEKTRDIFISLGFYEKVELYKDFIKLADSFSQPGIDYNKTVYKWLVACLTIHPFAIFTFLFMFPYLGEIQIPTQEILPSVFVDDLLTLAGDTKLLYELAVTFDKTLDGDYYQKTNYRYIILALMEVQMDGEPFPEKRIWKSIFSNEEEDFRKCCNEFSTSWAKIITMKPIFCDEMRTVQKDPRMNRLKLKKWKPLHFMVYFDRAHLLNDILEFSGTSITKTIAIENKKKGTRDEFLSLKICINMKNSRCFRILWKESSVWTVKHLFLVIKELADPQMYSEKIHKVILTSQTTIDILKYSNKTIRKQLKRQIKALQDSKT